MLDRSTDFLSIEERLFFESTLHNNFAVTHHLTALGKDMNQIHVFVKEVEVSAIASLHHALAGQLQSLGNVARDHGLSSGHRHTKFTDQALDFLEVAGNAADAQANHLTLVVETRHGAVSVRTHRDVIGRHTGFKH